MSSSTPDLLLTCVPTTCFGLPFLANVGLARQFPQRPGLTRTMAEEVVYVHGLWMSGGESLLLRRRLSREFGMEVHPFRYAAAASTMSDITARLQRFVRDLKATKLHFVGHRLGGLGIYRFFGR